MQALTQNDINYIQQQNTNKAYNRNNISSHYLGDITEKSETKKAALVSLMGQDTLIFTRAKTSDELAGLPVLKRLINEHDKYSFSFVSKTVTERATGACKPLVKFIEDKEQVQEVIAACNEHVTLVLSVNPWFFLGCSVKEDGKQLDSSCHFPGGDYASGPVSYALDNCSMVAGLWEEGGLVGRMMIHADLENVGIVTSRLYGDFSETDSTFIRKELYKFFTAYKSKDWKKTGDYSFNDSRFTGYTDSSCYVAFRPQNSAALKFSLVAPVCPECGSKHSEQELTCCQGRYTCDDCGERIHEDDMYSTDNGCYCQSCFDESYFYCDQCGETHGKDELCECNGRAMCTYCAEKKGFYKCSDCGDYVEDYTILHDECLCDNCRPEGEYCEHCGDFYAQEDITSTQEGLHYCPDCIGDYATLCEHCGEYTDSTQETIEGYQLCNGCADELTACTCCGAISLDDDLLECNPVCSEDCATTNMFNGSK